MTIRVLDAVVTRIAARALPRWLAETDGLDYDAEQTTEDPVHYISKTARDEVLLDAISVASPALWKTLTAVAGGAVIGSNKRIRSTALSLRRYEIRFAARAVPFGRFAGVGEARKIESSTDPAERRAGPTTPTFLRRRRPSTPAAEPLDRATQVMTNPGVIRRRLTWTLDGDLAAGRTGSTGEVSVDADPVCDAILSVGTAVMSVAEMITLIHRSHPTDEESIVADIDTLHRLGFLIHVHASDIEVSDIDSSEPEPSEDLHVNTLLSLPAAVFEEVEDVLDVMRRVCPPLRPAPALDEFHRQFVEKFGIYTDVPLVSLIDPEAGLGYPNNYDTRGPGYVPSAHDPHRFGTSMTHLLADQQSMTSGEFELTDTAVALLERANAGEKANNWSGDIGFFLSATSPNALNDGKFALIRSTSGSHHLGSLGGRFRYFLSDHHTKKLNDVTHSHTALAARVSYQPVTDRAAHVRSTGLPTARHHIDLGRTALDDGHIELDSIVVRSDGQHFALVRASDDTPITIVRQDMVSLEHAAPRLARLLTELSTHRTRQSAEWSWGPFSTTALFLPQVRRGRTILRRRQWRLPPPLLDQTNDAAKWAATLDDWATTAGIPRFVEVPNGDQGTCIDRHNPLDLEILQQEIGRSSSTWIQESVIGFDGVDYNAGHLTEIVLPYVDDSLAPPKGGHSESAATVSTKTLLPHPDRSWIYFKIYAAPAHQQTLLTVVAATITGDACDGIAQWHYLRYADPRPHLRLRLHVPDPADRARIRSELRDHLDDLRDTRMCSSVIEDSYIPETDRYGGQDCIRWAERVFHYDSLLAPVFESIRSQPDRRVLIHLATVFADIAESVIGKHWMQSICAHVGKTKSGQDLFRRDRAWYLAEFDSAATCMTNQHAFDHTRTQWRSALSDYGRALARAEPRAIKSTSVMTCARSLMHLHLNRSAGINPTLELKVLAVLRGCCEAELNRQRFSTDTKGQTQ